MITKLEHSTEVVAKQIYSIFQNAYIIEAQLIGVDNFPPLLRTYRNIQLSESLFYGYKIQKSLAAVLELMIENDRMEICSLTVEPTFFRKGAASKLLDYTINELKCTQAIVETAVANTPAITLYEKYGFVEMSRWYTPEDIHKVTMVMKMGNAD